MKKIFIYLNLTILVILIISYGCMRNTKSDLIIGEWRLDSLSVYDSGVEKTYLLYNKSYITKKEKEKYLHYENKAPIKFVFNKYGETFTKFRTGEIEEGTLCSFRISQDTIFSKLPQEVYELLGNKESDMKIIRINEYDLILHVEGEKTVFSDPFYDNTKVVTIYYLSREL